MNKRLARLFALACGYLALTLIATYPLVLHFDHFFIGGDEDGSISVWGLWWMKFATLTLKQNFLDSNYLFFPEGVNLTFHSLPKVLGFIFMPLSYLLPQAAAYNLVIAFTFVASGLGAYWLSRRLLDNTLAAFLAGVFFAFSAYRMGQSSHANLLPTMLIPVYILLLLRAKDALFAGRSSWPAFVAAGATLGLIAYDTEHYAIFLIVFTVAFWFFYLPLRRDRSVRWQGARFLAGLALTMLVAALVFLPMLMAAARQVAQVGDIVRVSGEDLELYSADALSFFLPHHQWYLLGHPFASITKNFRFWESTYLGAVVLMLAAVGAIRYRKQRETKLWLLTAVLFVVLALGPTLYFSGENTGLPLPYRTIHHLPLLDTIRTPGRYLVVATLALAILAGGGINAIFERLRKLGYARLAIPVAAALVTIAFLLDTSVQLPMVSLDTPAVYDRIAESDLSGSVVSLPLGWLAAGARAGTPGATFVELYQATHQRPLLGGSVSRAARQQILAKARTPVLDFLSQPSSPISPNHDPAVIAAALDKYQIAYIVVHKVYPQRIYEGELLPQSPIFDAATLAKIELYVTATLAMEKFEETEEIVAYRKVQ